MWCCLLFEKIDIEFKLYQNKAMKLFQFIILNTRQQFKKRKYYGNKKYISTCVTLNNDALQLSFNKPALTHILPVLIVLINGGLHFAKKITIKARLQASQKLNTK